MALRRLGGVALDSNGRAISGAAITVFAQNTTTASAIFSDEAGATTKANPFTADTAGRWDFYIDTGVFDIKIVGGGVTYTLEDVTVQNLLTHASRHSKGGADEITHANLAGLTANDHVHYLLIDPETGWEGAFMQRIAEMEAMIAELYFIVHGDTMLNKQGGVG